MGMRLRSLLLPLNMAGLVTLTAIGATLIRLPAMQWPLAYGLLLAFAGLMLLEDFVPRPSRWVRHALILAMGVICLVLLALFPRAGSIPILTVIWAAMIARSWPAWIATVALLVGNAIAWWLLSAAGFQSALMSVVLIACFQLFAVLTVHYARSAEAARDRLALVNADLLATRALLVDASRDAERLRVARELHDVAGHKLTALRLNLRALADDTAASSRLRIAKQLSAELLDDIRSVVYALRDVDGLDIGTALQALAAPFPYPRLQFTLEDGTRINDPAVAATVLHVVQEALTNSARHAEARTLSVTLSSRGAALYLQIEDDGRLHGHLREGNGLTGMRERIEERGGRIAFARSQTGALRIEAEIPA